MFKRLIIIPLVLIMAACSVNPDDPVSSSDPLGSEQPADANSYLPQAGDALLTRGEVYLETSDILTLESYPLQFNLTLTGSLPTPCHQLRVVVQPPDANNQILIEVYSVVDPESICAQVLDPFELTIPLGSFPSGKYSVLVNGEVIAEIQS